MRKMGRGVGAVEVVRTQFVFVSKVVESGNRGLNNLVGNGLFLGRKQGPQPLEGEDADGRKKQVRIGPTVAPGRVISVGRKQSFLKIRRACLLIVSH